jgi:formylglycine-generating enzyme required for sulfatase activity
MKDSTNPVGGKDKKERVSLFLRTPIIYPARVGRGGYWRYDPGSMRASIRYNYSPASRYDVIGFRLVKNKGKT